MAANSSANSNALVQLVVLTSLTAAVGALLFYGAYQKRKQLGSAEQQQKARAHKHASVDAAAPKDVAAVHDSPKKPAPAPTPTPLPQKQPGAADAPTPAPPAPPVNIGQEQATAATKKYKEGAFKEAVELYTEAIRLCENAVPVDTRNLKVMFSNRAAAHERLHDYASVVADCSSALVLDKRHPKSYLRRAKAKAAQGQLASALVDYVCLLVISEEKQEQIDEQLALEISRIHTEITTQEIEAAVARKTAAGATANRFLPDQFFITSYYSSFHASDDENDVVADKTSVEYTAELDALNDIDDADAVRAQRGELLTKRALAFKHEKEYERAASDLSDALALVQPGDVAYYTAQLESGTFYHLRGDFAVAKTCFTNALAAKPQSIFAKIRMGGLSFDQKDMKQALEWFEQALAEKPECSTAFFHRGQLHSIDIAADGSNAEAAIALALRDLEQCIALAPDFAMAYIQLGVTHARTGNFQQAVECLQTATVITPDVPEVYNYLGETYMQLLQVPNSGVDFATVQGMFDKAIELDPTYPMAYINQGNLMVSKGSEYGHVALELFERAVQMCPRSKFAYCHLAQVYMAMQDYPRALEQIDKAIAYALSNDELQELYALRITAETHQQAQVLLQ